MSMLMRSTWNLFVRSREINARQMSLFLEQNEENEEKDIRKRQREREGRKREMERKREKRASPTRRIINKKRNWAQINKGLRDTDEMREIGNNTDSRKLIERLAVIYVASGLYLGKVSSARQNACKDVTKRGREAQQIKISIEV